MAQDASIDRGLNWGGVANLQNIHAHQCNLMTAPNMQDVINK